MCMCVLLTTGNNCSYVRMYVCVCSVELAVLLLSAPRLTGSLLIHARRAKPLFKNFVKRQKLFKKSFIESFKSKAVFYLRWLRY